MRQISTKNKLKANHNTVSKALRGFLVAANIYKEQTESKSQPNDTVIIADAQLRQISTKNKLKANHNRNGFAIHINYVAANIYKEQTESKSQLLLILQEQMLRCGKYLQRTN